MIFDLVVRPNWKPKQQKLKRGTAGQVPDSQAASETYDYLRPLIQIFQHRKVRTLTVITEYIIMIRIAIKSSFIIFELITLEY